MAGAAGKDCTCRYSNRVYPKAARDKGKEFLSTFAYIFPAGASTIAAGTPPGRQEGQHMKEIKLLISDDDNFEIKFSKSLKAETAINCLCTALVNVFMQSSDASEAQANKVFALMFEKAAAAADDGQQEAEKAGQEWKH